MLQESVGRYQWKEMTFWDKSVNAENELKLLEIFLKT